ncbi:MAG: siderophore-interacting protein [Bifidobacterium crudilactis]|uniref:Siderophore-interacting protein n=1 Tax=Bifidobacterium crudilactis TaxID=327277 RepID=A0A971D0X4_9BIFI|nr:siderophore-interacting protein [Bifidobacterium crudilactis]
MGRGIQGAVLDLLGAAVLDLKVVGIREVCNGTMRRITFSSDQTLPETLQGPAAWLRLWFPSADGRAVQRGYTISRLSPNADACDIDFFKHEDGGPASQWASTAKQGDRLQAQVMGSRPFQPGEGLKGVVMYGDETAFPAVCSIIRSLPAGVDASVVLGGTHDLSAFLPKREGHNIKVRFVGRETPASCVERVLEDLRHHGEGFDNWQFWAAGERAAVQAMRPLVSRRYRFPRKSAHIQAYWIAGRAF